MISLIVTRDSSLIATHVSGLITTNPCIFIFSLTRSGVGLRGRRLNVWEAEGGLDLDSLRGSEVVD